MLRLNSGGAAGGSDELFAFGAPDSVRVFR